MTRYDLVTNYRCGQSIEELEPADDGEWVRYEDIEAQRDELLAALEELRINANRLCDRQLGGSYEDDCRRSIAVADAAIKKSKMTRTGR